MRRIVGTDAHRALRAERSAAIIERMREWLARKEHEHLPKSPIGEAMAYAHRQWDRLTLFLTDPRIPIHNNASERRLRVIALGRKNYLFVGHPRAGRNLAGLYSVIGSCIANEIEPTEYLADVLLRVREGMSGEELDELLPDRWSPR